MLEGLKTARGIVRSLRIYYGHRGRSAAMDRLYSRFVQRGDLVFDVGAHVGDRIASFRRLGARVVAVEPQPALVKVLKLIYGRASDVTIEAVAVGRNPGTAELMINPDNPTVSTASRGFISAARGAPGWEAQRWTKTANVPMTTLDALIARHGVPAFVKIDVEGFEAEALAGPVAARSRRFRLRSPRSNATSRPPVSIDVSRSVTRALTPRLAKAKASSMPSGSTAQQLHAG